MRQIFRTLPWIHPSEPEVLQTLYRKYGRKIRVKKGETLKSGGEAPVLFFLEKGLAAYWVNRTTPGHTAIFHERDFGDKTKSLLSPLVTGSKSSSVPAQEVS